MDVILVICRENVRDGLYNGWLIVAYTDGGKAPALSLVVSLLTVLFLTGRYLLIHCFMADSISFGIKTLGKVVRKEQQKEEYCFVGRGNRIGHGCITWRTTSLFSSSIPSQKFPNFGRTAGH